MSFVSFEPRTKVMVRFLLKVRRMFSYFLYNSFLVCLAKMFLPFYGTGYLRSCEYFRLSLVLRLSNAKMAAV